MCERWVVLPRAIIITRGSALRKPVSPPTYPERERVDGELMRTRELAKLPTHVWGAPKLPTCVWGAPISIEGCTASLTAQSRLLASWLTVGGKGVESKGAASPIPNSPGNPRWIVRLFIRYAGCEGASAARFSAAFRSRSMTTPHVSHT